MDVKIFDSLIPVRSKACSIDGQYYEVTPKVNLFVTTSTFCQANCDFCIYHGKENEFNVEKYGQVLRYLSDRDINLYKLNFTGGEPTVNKDRLNKIIECTEKNIGVNQPYITLNTNGFDLDLVLDNQDFFDSISISRHHFLDKENKSIFKTEVVPDENELKQFLYSLKDRKKVQLRCNLIKGKIDNLEKIKEYLNWAINIKASDCGFVTLMPNNKFCTDNQINFSELIKTSDEIIEVNSRTRLEEDKIYCRCSNYVYQNENGEFCKFYARHFCNNYCMDGTLVYDGKNLLHGFGGKIIF